MRRIKGNETMKEGLSQECDGVPAHGHQQAGVGKHHDAGGATCHRHAITRYPPQPGMLPFKRVIWNNDVILDINSETSTTPVFSLRRGRNIASVLLKLKLWSFL